MAVVVDGDAEHRGLGGADRRTRRVRPGRPAGPTDSRDRPGAVGQVVVDRELRHHVLRLVAVRVCIDRDGLRDLAVEGRHDAAPAGVDVDPRQGPAHGLRRIVLLGDEHPVAPGVALHDPRIPRGLDVRDCLSGAGVDDQHVAIRRTRRAQAHRRVRPARGDAAPPHRLDVGPVGVGGSRAVGPCLGRVECPMTGFEAIGDQGAAAVGLLGHSVGRRVRAGGLGEDQLAVLSDHRTDGSRHQHVPDHLARAAVQNADERSRCQGRARHGERVGGVDAVLVGHGDVGDVIAVEIG